MKIAAAYIRVSTDDQLEYSPDSQLKLIREYARKNGYILPEEFVYIDEGISGKTAQKRPAFNEMIAVAKQKENSFDVILVWKFSRFARNQEESIVYKKMLKKSDVEVVSISEPIADDAFGSLIERIIEWMDEYYVIRLSDEVKRGMTEKASRGEPLCKPPYGYFMRDKRYFPEPEQAPIVKDMFERYARGETVSAITRHLQDIGVRTIRGNVPDHRFVEYALRNPVYAGKIRWCTDGKAASARDFDNENFIIVEGEHEAIVPQELFDAVQQKFAETAARYKKYERRDQPVEFMLKGLVRCGDCGGTLVYSCKGLQCHNYNGRRGCIVSHYLSLHKANELVIDGMRLACETLTFNLAPREPAKPDDNTARLQALLAREKKKLDKIRESYQAGIDTLEEYRAYKAEITENIKQLEVDLKKLSQPKTRFSKDAYAKKVRGVVKILENGTVDEKAKNEALRTVIDHITYNVGTEGKFLDLYFYT